MRILYLTNGYPPQHTAGTENYTADIASEIAARGHSVQVVCAGAWDTGLLPFNGLITEEARGVTVTRLNLNWTRGPDPNGYLFNNPNTASAVEEVLDAFRPDLVHFTSGYTLTASVIESVKRLGYPLLVTLTDFWFLCPRVTLRRWDGTICDGRTTAWECLRCLLGDSRAYRWPAVVLPKPLLELALTAASERPAISRQRGLRGRALNMAQRKALLPQALEQADVIIAPSQFLAEVYAAAGTKANIRVIPYGHDLGWTRRLPGRAAAAARLRVGYVGRMTEDKGVHVLLQAVREAGCHEHLDVHFYGGLDQEPVYTQKLLALAAGLDRVTWHGHFNREQLAEVYGQLDVLVVPSLWHENNPLVIQEAFAAGVPVIASRMSGMAEFVTNGVTGLLFEAGSATDLAEALCLLAEHPGMIEQMRADLPSVRTIEEEADDLQVLYWQTVQQASPP